MGGVYATGSAELLMAGYAAIDHRLSRHAGRVRSRLCFTAAQRKQREDNH
jgi:hypothetical protein